MAKRTPRDKDSTDCYDTLVIRPTPGAMIDHAYAKWIQSHRDSPILINLWNSVSRWENQIKRSLRTSEFYWQGGHAAHATAKEAAFETRQMPDVYADMAINVAAIRLKIDDREHLPPGFKFNGREMRGVPSRSEVGLLDVEQNSVALAHRDVPGREGEQFVSQDGPANSVGDPLVEIQAAVFARAY